jgi:multiple sugar transport system substrate-binding protein
MPDDVYDLNPIALYERMATEDSIAYCPFAYTYSNYSRDSFAQKHIRFSNPVAMNNATPMRTVLGGTGIALSDAWDDPLLNQLTDEFFLRTSASIRTAYVRPRYRGYVVLQERAGQVIAEFCKQHGNSQSTLQRIDALYRSSVEQGQHV